MEALGIDWKLIIAQLINFALLFFLLRKFLFRPILKTLEERRVRIVKGLGDAQKIGEELVKLEEKKAKEIKRAQEEGQRLINEVKLVRDKLLEEAKSQATSETHRMLEKTQKQIAAEHEQMYRNLKKEITTLTLLAAEKLISQKLNEQKNEDFIKDIIGKIEDEEKLVH